MNWQIEQIKQLPKMTDNTGKEWVNLNEVITLLTRKCQDCCHFQEGAKKRRSKCFNASEKYRNGFMWVSPTRQICQKFEQKGSKIP